MELPHFSSNKIYVDQTDDYIITSADLDNWVTISFNNPVPLNPGTTYMLGIGGYANPIDTFGISVSGPGQGATNWIQDNGCNLGSSGIGQWYYINPTPMIRMNLGNTNVALPPSPPCSDLFISEYVEGTGQNKAIEIYNPTSSPINLSHYQLERYSNGSTNSSSGGVTQLSGVILPGDVFVVTNGDTIVVQVLDLLV